MAGEQPGEGHVIVRGSGAGFAQEITTGAHHLPQGILLGRLSKPGRQDPCLPEFNDHCRTPSRAAFAVRCRALSLTPWQGSQKQNAAPNVVIAHRVVVAGAAS